MEVDGFGLDIIARPQMIVYHNNKVFKHVQNSITILLNVVNNLTEILHLL